MSSNDFFARLRAEQARDAQPSTTFEDVLASVSEVWTREPTSQSRVRKVLESFRQYGGAIDVFAQHYPEVVSLVWGALKLILQIAPANIHFWDTVVRAYEQIASELPKLDRYVKLFSDNPEIQDLVIKSFKDVLEFNQFTVKEFTKSEAWKKSLGVTYAVFENRFEIRLQKFLDNLRQYKSLIESHATLAEMEQSKASREESRLLQQSQLEMLQRQLKMSREAEANRQITTILETISAASVDVDQWSSARVWRRFPEFGEWLLRDAKIQNWIEQTHAGLPDQQDSLLHLKGPPGAGKTIVASKLIDLVVRDIIGPTGDSFLFFYFKENDPSRNSLIALLKALLAQIVQMNLDFGSLIYDEFSKMGKLAFQSLDTLMRLTETGFERRPAGWMILDGLDECSQKERKRIVAWVLQLARSPSLTNIRVLFTSQDKSDLRSLLAGVPSISLMERPEHLDQLRAFSSRKVRKLREKYGFSEEVETDIVDKVLRHANGNFLFVKLVSKYLKSRESRAQFDKELDDRRFPTGLDDLAERLYSCQAFSGKSALNIDLASTNRCLAEAVAQVQRDQHGDSQLQDIPAVRRIPQNCPNCHVLDFQEHSLTIPLDKLMYSSISCHVCHTLCKAIILLDHEWLEKAHSSSVLSIERNQGNLCFQVKAIESRSGILEGRNEAKWGFPMILHIFRDQSLENIWSGLHLHRPIFKDSGSDECIEKIAGWLTACENEHVKCLRAPKALQNDSPGVLTAKRVIDLGNPDQIYPRLVSTGSHVRRWTALSYCWGKQNSFTTREINVEQREVAIPWASIPATFQDAMTLTHRLGIQYIWIDAVCIIQDSAEDWLAEAEKMGNIYQDAAVVIAADWAPNCDSGIFSTRQRHSLALDVDLGRYETSSARQKIFVEKGSTQDLTSHQSDPSQWHTGAFLRHSVLESNSRTLNKRWQNPTLRRAWCFQERLLATRIVHFTAAELIWECKTKIDCECGIRHSSSNTLKRSLDNALERLDASDHAALVSLRETASKIWWNLVVEYSWCNITFRSDRLPAISAMARLFPALGEYWEGMWRQELPLSLLWREEFIEDSDMQPPLENDKPTAPSWSWASALYPIQEPDWSHDQITSKVVDVKAPPSDEPKIYGQISDRSLRLRGPVLEGVLRYITDSFYKKPMIQLRILLEDGSTAPGMDFESSRLRFHADHNFKFDEKQSAMAEIEVKCLAIKSTISPEHGRVLDCLVLRLSAPEEGAYVRVGLATYINSPVESESVFMRVAEVKIV